MLVEENTSESEYSSDEENLPKKKFVFTFSSEEWLQIQPEEKLYKCNDKLRPMMSSRSYYVLPKSSWTPVLAEHFWVHTQLPCVLSFRRAKVYPNGSAYIHVVARCSVCDSKFNGLVEEKPPGNSK